MVAEPDVSAITLMYWESAVGLRGVADENEKLELYTINIDQHFMRRDSSENSMPAMVYDW